MRIRDMAIMALVAGMFFFVYASMLDTSNYEMYDTAALHAGENGSAQLVSDVQGAANATSAHSNSMQDQLMSEDITSWSVIGGNTWAIMKYIITFDFLQDWKQVIFNLAVYFQISPYIVTGIFSIMILVAVFTIIGAALRWRT